MKTLRWMRRIFGRINLLSRVPRGDFRISIDDGYVEYSFDAAFGGNNSIADVQSKIAMACGVKCSPLKMRTGLSDGDLLIQRNQLRYYLANLVDAAALSFDEVEFKALEKLLEETKG